MKQTQAQALDSAQGDASREPLETQALEGAPGAWQRRIHTLRWAAIVLPVAFLVILDVLRHTLFEDQLHRQAGFLGSYALIAVSVAVFSFAMFGLVERLQRELAERNRNIVALNDLAKVGAGELQLDELLSASLDHILPAMRADAGLICLIDAEHREHSAACARGFSPGLVSRIQRAKLDDDPIASEVFRTGRAVDMRRFMSDPRIVEGSAKEGIKAAVSTPLKAEGAVNGVLVAATRTDRVFTAREQEFLEGIGLQLGLAINNALLYEKSQRRNRELAALHTVSKAVASSLDLDEVITKALDAVLEVTATDAAELWLVEDGKEVVMRSHRGIDREKFLERTRFAIGEGFIGAAATSGSATVVHNLPSDPRFLRQQIVLAGFQTFGALPLRFHGGLVGVLAVAARSPHALKRPFELPLLHGIGERLANAIANARLYEQIREIGALQERERLAREMHDGMGQLLGYFNTQTLALKKLLASGKHEEALAELNKMEEIARGLYGDVREGILGLRASSRRDAGLLELLEEYIAQYRLLAEIEVSVIVSPEVAGLSLPSNVEIQLLRIIQEGLSNVRKHARASTARVALGLDGESLRVEIVDDGQGFNPQNIHSSGWPHFGLQTMQERAQSVGGGLTVESAPGRGCRVLVRVPAPVVRRPQG